MPALPSIAQPTSTRDGATAHSRRRVRFAAQRVLWRESSLDRIKTCGRFVQSATGGVQLRVTERADGRHAGFAGVQTCGSVWACPTCSAKIFGSRQTEVATAVEAWRARGGRVAMATFTMRHQADQSLASLWAALSSGWSAMTSGRAHQVEKEIYGVPTTRVIASGHRAGQTVPTNVLPWLRVVEVTHGSNGWHVHVHMILFLPHGTTRDQLWELYGAMWGRWNTGLRSAGVDGSRRVNVASFFEGDDALSWYVTKNTYTAGERLGLEVARGDLKRGRFDNRGAMEILADVVMQPDGCDPESDMQLWHEYEQASRGKRQMTWARGSRPLLALREEEATDEELAAEEVGTKEDTIEHLTVDGYAEVIRVPGRRAELLEVAETAPGDYRLAVRLLLASWGLSPGTPARTHGPDLE